MIGRTQSNSSPPSTNIVALVENEVIKIAMIKWRVLNALAKKPGDVTPQIAKRVYEWYEQRGHQDGQAVEDWEQAEGEVRNQQFQKKTCKVWNSIQGRVGEMGEIKILPAIRGRRG